MEAWKIQGSPWWDDSYSMMRFVIENDGKSYSCAISQIALNDHFGTEDSKNAATSNFFENPDKVIHTAVKLIQANNHDEQGTFLITSDIF